MRLIRRTIAFLLVLGILAFSGVSAYEALTTERYVISQGDISISKDVTATVARKEKKLKTKITGEVVYSVSNLERVSRKTKIGAVYSDRLGENDRNELTTINAEIASLQSGAGENTYKHNKEGLSLASAAFQKDIIAHSANNDYDAINKTTNSFSTYLDGKSVARDIATLKARKAKLEHRLKGSFQTIYSPMSGVFVSGENGNVGRVVDNYEVLLTAKVPNSFLEKTYVGYSYPLVFQSMGIKTTGEVLEIQKIDDTDTDVTFAVRSYVDKFYNSDDAQMTIVFDNANGLKLPKEAVQTQGEEMGVYIKNGREKTFQPITIIAQNEDYIIIASDEGVKDFDEVMIKR